MWKESHNRPGAVGPQTPYGRAYGSMQVQDGTAQQMAQKLGLPWRPDMMRGTDPDSAAYQKQIGTAYLQEGLTRFGGDPRKALMYYHGGPNQRLWGPKTHAYADDILSQLGGQ